jgi:hypothetical protein
MILLKSIYQRQVSNLKGGEMAIDDTPAREKIQNLCIVG